ncbi:MAG: helix-turn-helix domain-containing protein [Proteobacteria bacterium]|nr:helix-turn-helix domain-containing protein [Pseudomonadota bacterium]
MSTRQPTDPSAEIMSVDAGNSFEEWHEVTCWNYSRSEFERDRHERFAAHITMRQFGALGLSTIESGVGVAKLRRTAIHIRGDQRDHFMLFLVTAGEIGIDQDGREASASASDFFLYDQTRPLVVDFKTTYRARMLSIPRPMLTARVGGTRDLTARSIAGGSKLGALVATLIGQLDGFGPETRPNIVERIGASTLDFIATANAVEAGGTLPGDQTEHRLSAAAKAFLRANLDDPALDAATITRALNTSPRSLNRAFALEGTTPMRWLWLLRLDAAHRALATGRTRSVTDAAFAHGFNDVSHFSRAFRNAFGTPPRSVLRPARRS